MSSSIVLRRCRLVNKPLEIITSDISRYSHICIKCKFSVSIPIDIRTNMDCANCGDLMMIIEHYKCVHCNSTGRNLSDVVCRHLSK